MRAFHCLCGAAFLAILCGCGPSLGDFTLGPEWEDAEGYATVWSEDDFAFAYSRVRYERLDGWDGTQSRNHRYSLYVRDRDGKKPRQVLGERQEAFSVLHYMRQEGYLIASMPDPDQGSSGSILNDTRTRKLVQVTLDGKVTPVSWGFWTHHDVVPSPDGKLLAKVSFDDPACRDLSSGYAPCLVRFWLLSAATLAEASSDTATFMVGWGTPPNSSTRGKPVAVWSPEGDLYLTNDHEAVRKTPGQALVRQGPRACKYPNTRSGPVSSSREVIAWWDGKFEIKSDSTAAVFGCPSKEG